MAVDDFSLKVVDEICRHGFSFAFAFAALADARDLICRRVEAEIARKEREEIRANSERFRRERR